MSIFCDSTLRKLNRYAIDAHIKEKATARWLSSKNKCWSQAGLEGQNCVGIEGSLNSEFTESFHWVHLISPSIYIYAWLK